MRDRRRRDPGQEAGEVYPTGVKPGAATLTRHLPQPRPNRAAPARVDPMIGDGGGGDGDGDDDDRDRGRPLFPDEPPLPWLSAAPGAVPGTAGVTVAEVPSAERDGPASGEAARASASTAADTARATAEEPARPPS